MPKEKPACIENATDHAGNEDPDGQQFEPGGEETAGLRVGQRPGTEGSLYDHLVCAPVPHAAQRTLQEHPRPSGITQPLQHSVPPFQGLSKQCERIRVRLRTLLEFFVLFAIQIVVRILIYILNTNSDINDYLF